MDSTIEGNTSVDNGSKVCMLEVILDIIEKLKSSKKPAEASFYFSSMRDAYVRFYGVKKFNNIWHFCHGWTSASVKFEKMIKYDIEKLKSYVY